MADVFISYSRVDAAFIGRLDEFLAQIGVTSWMDKKSLLPGQRWEDAIEDAISDSRAFLTCISQAGLDKKGYFHVEQHQAAEAALRVPPERMFVLPVTLGECDVPRRFRQYHVVNLVEIGAIEMLVRSLSSAVDRELHADPDAVTALREELREHLGTEGASNKEFIERFLESDAVSFQDSMGIVTRIANSSDPKRLQILLELRAKPFLSYAEQAALDRAITNVKAGQRTENLQASVKADEMARIAQMSISGDPNATALLQLNKYVRYVSRRGSEPYLMAEAKIHSLLLGRE